MYISFQNKDFQVPFCSLTLFRICLKYNCEWIFSAVKIFNFFVAVFSSYSSFSDFSYSYFLPLLATLVLPSPVWYASAVRYFSTPSLLTSLNLTTFDLISERSFMRSSRLAVVPKIHLLFVQKFSNHCCPGLLSWLSFFAPSAEEQPN